MPDATPTTLDTIDPPTSRQRLLGRGRSAVVWQVTEPDGRRVARKVFLGDPLAKLVHFVFSGAGNPYTWNADAIAASVCRRHLLRGLVAYWFGTRLRLPEFYSAGWSESDKAYEIRMEMIRGRAASLHQTFTSGNESDLTDLWRNIMQPLQRHLIESGFDGLAWQAGTGNPVAASNFLVDAAETGIAAEDAGTRWVWIDLESGVPALFPLNPLALVGFYLPRSLRYGHVLFDDVDTQRLRRYLAEHQLALAQHLGANGAAELLEQCQRLEEHQRRWWSMSRLQRSVTYAFKRGRIDAQQAEWYQRHALRWYARLAVHGGRRAVVAAAGKVRKVAAWVHPLRVARLARGTWHFLSSQKYRSRLALHLIMRRISHWQRRGQLSPAQARYLRQHVKSEEATSYLTDFGIHVALKPPVKMIEWWLLPALYAAGFISGVVFAVGVSSGGMIARTLYTLGRLIQATLRGRERPWVALGVGVLPVVGNAAYPAQIVYTSTEADHRVAQFILYDLFTAVGRKVPIWGGPDTMTEHFFNRIPSLLFRRRKALAPPQPVETPVCEAEPASTAQ